MGTEGFSPFANRRQKLIPKMQERLIRKIGSVRMRVRGPIGGPQRFDRSTDQVFVDLKKAERIRLLLYSQDLKLQPVLAPALGREFQVTVEPNPDRVRTLIAGGLCDVLVLDLDCAYSSVKQQVALFGEIVGSGMAIVVMTQDDARATAIELMERGAYGSFRKPPALREVRAIVRLAHEHSVLKRRVEGMCQASAGAFVQP